MISDVSTTFPREFCQEWEKNLHGSTAKFYALMANDVEKQNTDVLLYPGKVSVEELKSIKSKIIPMAAEFDVLRRDTIEFVQKLKECGKYVDHSMYAGVHNKFFLDEECGDLSEKWYKDM